MRGHRRLPSGVAARAEPALDRVANASEYLVNGRQITVDRVRCVLTGWRLEILVELDLSLRQGLQEGNDCQRVHRFYDQDGPDTGYPAAIHWL